MQIVLPTPHRKNHARRTPVSLTALRTAWRRPTARDMVFSPMPVRRVLTALLPIVVVIRVNDLIQHGILTPLLGPVGGEIVSTVLTIASVLLVTQPLFRPYSGQWAEVLAWYGIVLATLTVFFETVFALYVQHLFGYEVLARYNVFRGQLWPFVVVAVGCTPLIWANWSQS